MTLILGTTASSSSTTTATSTRRISQLGIPSWQHKWGRNPSRWARKPKPHPVRDQWQFNSINRGYAGTRGVDGYPEVYPGTRVPGYPDPGNGSKPGVGSQWCHGAEPQFADPRNSYLAGGSTLPVP
eukprot:1582288-Rhodomonas_salina.1